MLSPIPSKEGRGKVGREQVSFTYLYFYAYMLKSPELLSFI
jgi:hypothetical protein